MTHDQHWDDEELVPEYEDDLENLYDHFIELRNQGATNHLAFKQMVSKVFREVERLRKVLGSIARNTCCDKCQEAALVARSALER